MDLNFRDPRNPQPPYPRAAILTNNYNKMDRRAITIVIDASIIIVIDLYQLPIQLSLLRIDSDVIKHGVVEHEVDIL